MTVLHELVRQGQSPWVHGLSCEMLDHGTLAALIEQGVRGATVGPAEVAAAVAEGHCNDEQLRRTPSGADGSDTYFALLAATVRRSCDALVACALLGSGRDGWVTAGVDPRIAHDAARTVEHAAWLHGAVGRPNFMVQVPATAEGIEAVRECTARGIPVDVTLLYSRQRYQDAANAYLAGLRRFAEAGGSPARVGSVASFPLAWLDAEADRRLAVAGGSEELRGTMAIATAKLAYQTQEEVFSGSRWEELAAAGASPQYCRWTATSPSRAADPLACYVEKLIGPDSITTMSATDLQAFCDHGTATSAELDVEAERASSTLDRFARAGVLHTELARDLEQRSLAQLAASFGETVSLIDAAREELRGGG